LGGGECEDLPMDGRDRQRGCLQRQRFNPLGQVWRHAARDTTARTAGATEGDQAACPVALDPAPGRPEGDAMVAGQLRQWDTAFEKWLDDLEADHGLLACCRGQRRQQWGRGLGVARRRVWM
jgi:hypothetical protein